MDKKSQKMMHLTYSRYSDVTQLVPMSRKILAVTRNQLTFLRVLKEESKYKLKICFHIFGICR